MVHLHPRSKPQPEARSLFVLAGRTGVDYTTRGSFCQGPPAGPTVSTASVYQSVPWTVVANSSTQATLRYTAPPCGVLDAITANGPPTVVVLFVRIPLARITCPPSPGATTNLDLAMPAPVLIHGPTGSVMGRITTAPDAFNYYDGVTHIAPPSAK